VRLPADTTFGVAPTERLAVWPQPVRKRFPDAPVARVVDDNLRHGGDSCLRRNPRLEQHPVHQRGLTRHRRLSCVVDGMSCQPMSVTHSVDVSYRTVNYLGRQWSRAQRNIRSKSDNCTQDAEQRPVAYRFVLSRRVEQSRGRADCRPRQGCPRRPARTAPTGSVVRACSPADRAPCKAEWTRSWPYSSSDFNHASCRIKHLSGWPLTRF